MKLVNLYLKRENLKELDDKVYLDNMEVVETKMLAMALNGSSLKDIWNNTEKIWFL